ncbi:MAG: LysR family transcriptional regulator [Roseburia sp.]|nr:LysR family transcriptional regulator [Roseburia sp.]
MTLNQLTYFYHAATLQHFNQAAEKANISEPSLSRSIAALEAEFNVILFEKKGRNVQLTKAGNVLLKHATYILNEVQATENKMHQIATDGGHIDIAYVSPLARNYVPRTVRAFLSKSQNKNVIFNFHQDITSKNVEGLKLGNYDLIFGSYAENEPDIEFIPIIQQEMVVILPKNHPSAHLPFVSSEIFVQYPVLSYDLPEFICESPDENGIASLVAEGFGIALVADVESIHRDDIIIKPLIPAETFSHTVYMGYLRDHYQLPAVKRLIDFIKSGQPD